MTAFDELTTFPDRFDMFTDSGSQSFLLNIFYSALLSKRPCLEYIAGLWQKSEPKTEGIGLS